MLPPDLHERLSQLSFWRQPGYSRAHLVRHANAGAGDADGAAKLVIASADEVSEPDLLPELHRLP
ncbi:hypothetical protein ACKZDW_17915 [Ralstonia syzygii subsp. celebesensis]